uniref:ICOS ligand n=1 Tax=Castor canadensis TaxID=51338 RepID=A0A8B7UWI3_CASCN|nr:ICOS ligand isoform X1 [Castor canadensis]
MLLRSPGLLLLLLSGLRAATQEKEVRAMVGSTVELKCIYPEENSFDLNDLYVYWQISGSNTVVTYYLPKNSSAGHENNHYKNRAHLSLDSMKQGDFSLSLQNVTPQDAQKFNCLVFRESLQLGKILEMEVSLHVAANYSLPVISTPSSESRDPELTFTCRSTNGYPRPNVYWINETDNSPLDKALQNDTVSLNSQGLYDVVSILRIPWTPNMNVGCCVENVLLHQNLTGRSQTERSSGTEGRITETPDSLQKEDNVVIFITLALLLVSVIVAVVIYMGKSKCPHRNYTGAQAATVVCELTGKFASQRKQATWV